MVQQRTFDVVFVGAKHGAGVEETANPDKQVQYIGEAVTVTP
jgi:hypothetical protein